MRPARYDHSLMPPPPTLEAWQRGPIDGIPSLLMPAAHAIVHAREDAERALSGLSTDEIWRRPAGGAPSVGFHVRHLGGALDRLLTYARAEPLTAEQRRRMASEGQPGAPPAAAPELLAELGPRSSAPWIRFARLLNRRSSMPAASAGSRSRQPSSA